MITFHLREFTHQFFQYKLVIPTQDITYDEVVNLDYKYLQFSGCKHIVLRLKTIGLNCSDKDTFEHYVEIGKVQVRPFYDQITVEIIDAETQQVYDTFTHRQDITSDTRRLEIVC